MDALKAVTTNTAEMLGMADCIGHFGVGMFADVIALDGNPLEDIACLRQVMMVMKEGEIIADVLSGASDVFSD